MLSQKEAVVVLISIYIWALFLHLISFISRMRFSRCDSLSKCWYAAFYVVFCNRSHLRGFHMSLCPFIIFVVVSLIHVIFVWFLLYFAVRFLVLLLVFCCLLGWFNLNIWFVVRKSALEMGFCWSFFFRGVRGGEFLNFL